MHSHRREALVNVQWIFRGSRYKLGIDLTTSKFTLLHKLRLWVLSTEIFREPVDLLRLRENLSFR